MTVTISDEIVKASGLTPGELRQEIALYLFEAGHLSLIYASFLAQMHPNAFRQLLKQRQIPFYSYDVEDLELDLKNLGELGSL